MVSSDSSLAAYGYSDFTSHASLVLLADKSASLPAVLFGMPAITASIFSVCMRKS